jgi:N utilization substance protein B
MLYSCDIGAASEEDLSAMIMQELSLSRAAVREAWQRVRKIQQHQLEIDQQITELSREYDFNRIQKVEKNILRLAMYEMFHDPTIPPKVAIAEALRICRKFSTPEAANFVNALLDESYKKHGLSDGISNK